MKDDKLQGLVTRIESLKSKSDQQEMLIDLFSKNEKTKDDERKIAALARAEFAQERAMKARLAAAAIVEKEAAAARREKEKHQKKLLGVLEKSGALELGDLTLAGLLAFGVEAKERHPEWYDLGRQILK